jgi:hypothetical protein
MQHKRRKPFGKLLVIGLGLGVVAVIAVLMTVNVPVKQAPVEQTLDAQTFLKTNAAP